jgi:hypothetical protein
MMKERRENLRKFATENPDVRLGPLDPLELLELLDMYDRAEQMSAAMRNVVLGIELMPPSLAPPEKRTTPPSWRAIVRFSSSSGIAHVPGVNGGSTKEGPWLDAFGPSARAAMDAAESAIGRAVLHLSEPVAR